MVKKLSTSFVVLTTAFIAIGTAVHAQLVNVTADGSPIIGIAVSPAAVASGTDENGQLVPPDPAQYGYTTNGYVNGGMLRGNDPDGTYHALVDGSTATYGDTEYDGFSRTATDGTAPMGYVFGSAYVGMTGLTGISAAHPVTTIQLTFALDLYGQPGSYFGDNGTGDVYQNGGTGDFFLHLPSTLTLEMQVTTDGTTWHSVAFNSNYVSLMNGLDVGDGTDETLSPTVTFTLANAADGSNIDGIRLIGTVGGGRDDGMLGVADMEVLAPEPSTYAMIALSMVGLFVLARFVRRTSTI